MLELKECSKRYRDKQVFESINYKLENKIYWLRGPNGIGKSVFCRCLVGLEKFSGGNVIGDLGNVLYLPDTSIADSWLTLSENIDILQYYFKISLDNEKTNEIKYLLKIEDEDELVSQLSVGTSMKVGLFLIFIEKYWKTIVLDETLSHIDNNVKEIVLKELEKRAREGASILIINHSELYPEGQIIPAHKLYLNKKGLGDIEDDKI